METSRSEDARAEIIAHQKGSLLEEIDGALAVCRRSDNPTDPIYPGQDKPLSFHLDRLRIAVEQDDMNTVQQYRRGAGSWFPYNNIVEMYLREIEG